MEDTENLEAKILEIEAEMASGDFWNDKIRAQEKIRELQELKRKITGAEEFDKGPAIITILSGAGGDDAEDFSGMLFRMYEKYFSKRGWGYVILHSNENDHGGYRNLTIEVSGNGAYGNLKHESGVHRLVRISPFNAKKLRHTSFSMVEVIPKLPKNVALNISDSDLRIELSRSSGPGGQNVNKRETAVRIVHIPTNLSAECQSERSQEHNKEKALEMLKAKIFKKEKAEREALKQGMQISKTTEIEWGNQIRSYVLHPYKMVKDHRTDVEIRDVESVLEEGEIDEFIQAEKNRHV